MTTTTTRPNYANINETRETAGGITVHRYRIIGTACVDYQALEQGTWDSHSTISSLLDGRRLGTVPSRRLPVALAGMKPGAERSALVREWQASVHETAYAAIVEAFPEAAAGSRCMGMIAGADYTVEA